jgi:integrase
MSDGLVSQIDVGKVESFFNGEKRRGRKRLLDKDKYLGAVVKLGTDNPRVMGEFLGVSRHTVRRFRKAEINDIEVDKILSDISNLQLKPYQLTLQGFMQLPIIQRFHDLNIRLEISEKRIRSKIRSLLNICRHLNVHPRKLKPEQCAELLIKVKNLPIEQRPKGVSWSSGREAVRSFFQLVHGFNGNSLTALGLHCKPSPRSGVKARQRLTGKQRREFLRSLEKNVRREHADEAIVCAYLTLPKFMFYTGTRISASLNSRIEDIIKKEDVWMIRIRDKGSNGGCVWFKILPLELIRDIERIFELRDHPSIGYLFDGIRDQRRLRILFREAYSDAGVNVEGDIGFDVTHIWRHTFAQELLEATEYNYELVASIGGWKSTYILKKYYGEIGDNHRIDALRQAMGERVEKTEVHFCF